MGRASARSRGRGQGHKGALSSLPGFDTDSGGGSSSSTSGTTSGSGGVVNDGDSLAARPLSSATQSVGLAGQEECGGRSDSESSSTDAACTTEREESERASPR